MNKDTIFGILFKCNSNGEKKLENCSQLTAAGRRVIILVINLALGGKPKNTLQWLKDNKTELAVHSYTTSQSFKTK